MRLRIRKAAHLMGGKGVNNNDDGFGFSRSPFGYECSMDAAAEQGQLNLPLWWMSKLL